MLSYILFMKGEIFIGNRKERSEKARNLGMDNIKSLLFSLAVPSIIGQLVNLLYSIVDRMYIGHIPEIGGDALTGIGVTVPPVVIISAFAMLIGVGGSPRVAIAMGKNDKKSAEEIIGNCFTALLIIGLVLTGFFLIFNKKILVLFGASQVTLPYALEYMNIYTLGSIFVQMAIGMNPFINTQGFARTSMFTILIGAVLNIILDPIFIFVLGMKVKGAAIATVISQAISAFWVLRFLTGDKTQIKLKNEHLRINFKILAPIIALGLSPFVMQITESMTTIAFNTNLQKYGGDVAVGAMTILTSAMQFTFLPLSGLTQGAQPIISYNYGAGNIDRVKEAFKWLLISCLAYSSIFWLFIMLAPQVFASMFTNDMAIIGLATWGLRVYMGGSLLLGAQDACQLTFVALGEAKTSLFLAMLRKVFLLIPLIFILPYFFTNKVFAVFLAEPIADIIAVAVTTTTFYKLFPILLKKAPEKTGDLNLDK